jgi:Na+/H+-dicarboxylate symporter
MNTSAVLLQIVVFSLFFGVACAALGDRARKLVEGIEELSHAILTITGYIMTLAPIAVFASMAAIVTTQGLGILVTSYGQKIETVENTVNYPFPA